VAAALREARESAGKVILLYTDELTLYRQPSQASLWFWRGRLQPKLRYSCRSNTRMRLLGMLDACTGEVFAWDYAKITAVRLGKHWLEAVRSYPEAEKIYIVMDNWPVHFHPSALGPLAQDDRVEILPLPTYAPWLNPIEKLWRLLKQHVCHAHPWCDDFTCFRRQVMQELESFRCGSAEVLRYVGLGH
jgi:transposase InsO family protein